jgi:hypothetical protein
MDRATFFREHLNVWTDDDQLVGIDPVTWASCQSDLMPGREVAIGLDITPERDRGALMVAGMSNDRCCLEVIETASDLERLVARAADIANRWDATIIIDRGSPAASTVPALERLTMRDDGMSHRVRLIPLTDLVRACGDFHDAAVHARLSHRGDYRLTDAVVGATKRKVGDAWMWSRRGHADITPLMAATLARWGIVAAPEVLVPAVW